MMCAFTLGPKVHLTTGFSPLFGLETMRAAVEAATGPAGLALVWLYSFLVAVVLPLPIQVVLVAPLKLGVPFPVRIGLIVTTSAIGTTAGGLCGFRFGHEVKAKALELWDPLSAYLPRSVIGIAGRLSSDGTWIGDWLDARVKSIIKRWGYFGLFSALCVPMFPHKTSVYWVSLLDDDYWRFSLAVLGGSIGRLLVSLALAGGALLAVK